MLMTQAQVCAALNVSRQTIWRWIGDPKMHFPRPVRLPTGTIRWVEYHVVVWAIWHLKCQDAARNGLDAMQIPPPNFKLELPTPEQAAMMLSQSKLDAMAAAASSNKDPSHGSFEAIAGAAS